MAMMLILITTARGRKKKRGKQHYSRDPRSVNHTEKTSRKFQSNFNQTLKNGKQEISDELSFMLKLK